MNSKKLKSNKAKNPVHDAYGVFYCKTLTQITSYRDWPSS